MSQALSHRLRAGFIAAWASCLAACTVIEVHNAQVETRWLPGVAVVDVHPGAEHVTLVRTQGLGLTLASRQATLGLLSQVSFAAHGEGACGTFIVLRTHDEVIALKQWLMANSMAQVQPCVFNLDRE